MKILIFILFILPALAVADSNRSVDQSYSNSKGTDISVNINALLLKEFISRYETSSNPQNTLSQRAFGDCLPLTGMVTEYPTLNSCSMMVGATMTTSGVDLSMVVPRRLAQRFQAGTCGAANIAGGSVKGAIMSYDMNPDIPYTRKYALCRLIASKFIAEAGERAVKAKVQSEDQITEEIRSVFSAMDGDDNLYLRFKAESKSIWQAANCAPTLSRWAESVEPDMRCGVLVIKGNDVAVEGRRTLSPDSIEGRNYKISMSADSTGKTNRTAKEVGRSSKSKKDINPLR